jgi:hypothetical protein
MTVKAKKHTVSQETRDKISAFWAKKRAMKQVSPKVVELLSPAPSHTLTKFLNFDPVTMTNYSITLSRAINHLADYKLRMEREGMMGLPSELDRVILQLGDINCVFRGQ